MGSLISKLVFQPPQPTYLRDQNLIWLHTAKDEVIPAFFINREKRFTILFSHGNAEDLGMIFEWFRDTISTVLDVNVFCYEYTGYGLSTGVPSEGAFYADIEAAYKYLTDVLGIPPDQIILYGRSIGSGPTCDLASKHLVRGVILQSPVLSAFRVAFHLRFTLPADLFPNIDKIGRIQCPVLIVHGNRDEIVPVWHGYELYRACKNPVEPFWIEGIGHNNIESASQKEFFDRLIKFVSYLRRQAAGSLVPDSFASDFHHENDPFEPSQRTASDMIQRGVGDSSYFLGASQSVGHANGSHGSKSYMLH